MSIQWKQLMIETRTFISLTTSIHSNIDSDDLPSVGARRAVTERPIARRNGRRVFRAVFRLIRQLSKVVHFVGIEIQKHIACRCVTAFTRCFGRVRSSHEPPLVPIDHFQGNIRNIVQQNSRKAVFLILGDGSNLAILSIIFWLLRLQRCDLFVLYFISLYEDLRNCSVGVWRCDIFGSRMRLIRAISFRQMLVLHAKGW